MAYDESSHLKQAGLIQKHQIQNGLLLCKICHAEFDLLKRYIDVVNDKLVLKVVNVANDETSDQYLEWKDIVDDLKVMRTGREDKWKYIDNRKAVEPTGEMALYFIENNPSQLPNRKALEFHKIACLIWRMAGGSEPDEEYCSDDELGPVNTASLRKRFNVAAENS